MTVASQVPESALPEPATPPHLPDKKRTRRQSKITEVFSVGRRSSRMTSKEQHTKELLASPTLRKTSSVGNKELEFVDAKKVREPKDEPKPSTETIVKRTSPLVAAVVEESVPIHEDPITPVVTPKKKQLPPPVDATVPVSLTDEQLPAVPAYQRFAHLISGPRPLALPSKFILLERILGAIDSVCMLAAGRDQPVIFHKSVKSWEATVGRRVELLHLQQIHGIFSDETLGTPQVPFLYRPMSIVWMGKRTETFALELPEAATHDYLYARRAELLRRLTAIMQAEHANFLQSINVQLPVGAKLRSWHPKFNLDSVPDLFPAELFPPKEVKRAALKVPTEVALVVDAFEKPQEVSPASTSHSTLTAKASNSVLEKIRAKQRRAEVELMTHDPVAETLKRTRETLLEFTETIAMYVSLVGGSSDHLV